MISDKNSQVVFMDQDQMMCQKKLQIKNPSGLHARPAAAIVKIVHGVESSVTFSYKRQTVDAKSILHLLMLAVPMNGWVTVTIEGGDAEEVMQKLEQAFQSQFMEYIL